jgi:hypothetical protein
MLISTCFFWNSREEALKFGWDLEVVRDFEWEKNKLEFFWWLKV